MAEMPRVRLGRTGVSVSRVCLGTMTFGAQADEAASFAILDIAADAGIDFLDAADMYPVPHDPRTAGDTETIIGKWLRGKRDRFVLASKVFGQMGPGPNDGGLSRRHVIEACEASLRRLQTDYLDLYYIHRWDPNTPVEETLDTFDDLRRAGKIRYAAASNVAAWQLMRALWYSDYHHLARFEVLQPRYNVLYREAENELFPACQANGLGVAVYNPLAAGLLTGKHRRGAPTEGTRFAVGSAADLYQRRYWQDAQFEVVDRLKADIESRGKSLLHASLQWTLEQPAVSCAILGASRPEQLQESLQFLDAPPLDDADRAALGGAWWALPRRPPDQER